MRSFTSAVRSLPLLLLSTLPVSVLGGDILSTNGFSTCVDDPSINVKAMNIQYDRTTRLISFDVAGTSQEEQKVEATLIISAYGQQVYTKSFNPCDSDSGMTQMCPLPAGSFASSGQQTIPDDYASKIPSIAFSVPDLDGQARLELKRVDNGQNVACITSSVGNGRTFQIAAISWIAGGIVAAAFALSAITALASGSAPGAAAPSPTFGEVVGWFQGMAMNGMMSVNYPTVYQSFTSNFGFSTGLIQWGDMQMSIDNFRKATGGNLTEDSYTYLKNVTLVYPDGTQSSNSSTSLSRRALESMFLYARDGTSLSVNGSSTTVGGDGSNTTATSTDSKEQHYVRDFQAYVEQLTIPQANTFMTLLLVFAIVIAAIIVLILLAKVILEVRAMFGQLPKSLESWRKRYWWRLAKAITNLILLLYGIWTLYCIYQFTNGDSWAAKTLAGVTLAIFTVILGWFTLKIWRMARQSKKLEGDAVQLYEDKETWIKYSLFYDSFKKGYWWFFIPAIVYMFAKGCVIAGANGHGLIQTGGQLIIEALFFGFLLWYRPYTLKSGNWVNITIHVVRVLSVVCILVFVEELGISQTTKTITGLVLIVVQCVLTGVLAILIAVNALIVCIRENPHRRKRKEAEKLNHDMDNLTSLDPRNSLLMEPMVQTEYKAPMVSSAPFGKADNRYETVPLRAHSPPFGGDERTHRFERDDSKQGLVSSAASMGYRDRSMSRSAHSHYRDESTSRSPPRSRQPRLPDVDFGRAL